MRKSLGYYPYRLQLVQELKEADYEKRVNFAAEFLANAEVRPDWLDSVLWSDEAIFTLDGLVNLSMGGIAVFGRPTTRAKSFKHLFIRNKSTSGSVLRLNLLLGRISLVNTTNME